MSIELKHAVRRPVLRAAFCLLILLPIGAVMASSKSTGQSNPFMQAPPQAGQTGAYTTQPGVVSQVAPASQDAANTSSTAAKSKNNQTLSPKAADGGGALPGQGR